MSILSRANDLERKLQSENGSEYNKVLRLEVGQPRTPPPKAVLDSLACASTSYTASLGTPELKKAIAHHYLEWYSVQVAPSAIAVTTGASGAFVATFLSCFDSGDRVAVSVPGYPCYRHTLLAMGVQVVDLLVDESTNFQPSVAHLSAEHGKQGLAGLVVASPSNPTGSVLSGEQLCDLAQFCKQNSIRLVVDEIYHGIGEHLPTTAMSLDDQVVVISSLSKFWCMTGFRVGWLATRDVKLMQAIERTMENMFLCAPSFSQHAAVAALSQPCEAELQSHVKRYISNQASLSDALRRAGFHPIRPQDGRAVVGGALRPAADGLPGGGDARRRLRRGARRRVCALQLHGQRRGRGTGGTAPRAIHYSAF
ncbi:1-aminocyclopropane-1-carboxylate deaminase [Gracilaria domingensis]|nr:1-aminocyclopropane-1-carboxylate deaminase [Gracilaria domingensis]